MLETISDRKADRHVVVIILSFINLFLLCDPGKWAPCTHVLRDNFLNSLPYAPALLKRNNFDMYLRATMAKVQTILGMYLKWFIFPFGSLLLGSVYHFKAYW